RRVLFRSILERGQQLAGLAVLEAQAARDALQQFGRAAGLQVGGIQLDLPPVATLQQFAAVPQVEAPSSGRVEQMIGAWHAQQEAAGKVDAAQRNAQPA